MSGSSEIPQGPSSPSYHEVVAAALRHGDRPPQARTWRTDFTFFCDETGNTGPQFYAPDQPLYMEAGWLVPNARCDELARGFVEVESRHGFSPQTKGTRLKDHRRGQECMAEALTLVAKSATPFLYVVEKRFFICAKAVETYFDPNYNPAIEAVETFDPNVRKLRADILYRAPEKLIAAFADAFRREDSAAIASLGPAWVAALRDDRQAGMAFQLQVGLPEIRGHMAEEFTRTRALGLPRGYNSLNAPTLAQTFQLIERSSPPCNLIHDQCESLAPIYQYFFDRYRNARQDLLPKLDGSMEIFGFRNLHSLSFGDSEQMPLLRACDYLTAMCVEFARRAIAAEDIPNEVRLGAEHGWGRMLREARNQKAGPTPFQIGEIMAADRWIEQLAARYVS